jgi:hypothetical protein
MTLWRYRNAIKANRTRGFRMKYKHLLLLTILGSGALMAAAQSDPIVGTWTLAATDKLLPHGTRVPDYGSNPHGLVIFTPIILTSRADSSESRVASCAIASALIEQQG